MSASPHFLHTITDAFRLVRTDYKMILKALAWPMLIFFIVKFSWVPFAEMIPLRAVFVCMFLGLIPLAWIGNVCLRVGMAVKPAARGWTRRETFSSLCLILVVFLSIPPWAIASVILKAIHDDSNFQFTAYAHFIIGWIFSVSLLMYVAARCLPVFSLLAQGMKIHWRQMWSKSKGRVLPLMLMLAVMVVTTHYIVGYVGYDGYPGANAHLFVGAVLIWCFNMIVLGACFSARVPKESVAI